MLLAWATTTKSTCTDSMQLSHSEFTLLVDAMRKYGGNFISKLADAMVAADPKNREKLLNAFPDEVSKYLALTIPF